MVLCEWKDFSTETETYTKERFEREMDDEFEAMIVDETGFPTFIWTVNYVILVTKRSKIIEEVEFTKYPRNPVCE
ncbi:MAG: hypothetical protein ACI35O_09580 [Bacillaceae bacterium]